jgi:cation:H+ antiporter
MTLALLAVAVSLPLLVWSADRFVDGSAAVARHMGMPSLLIGMVIVGFGTSAPEMVVSVLAAWQGSPGLALGNAYGSNIFNIAMILGVTALVKPLTVRSTVLRQELPLLTLVTVVAAWQLWDQQVSRVEAALLLALFAVLLLWSVWQGLRQGGDALAGEMEEELRSHPLPMRRAVLWMIAGLLLLLIFSRILVWGAVQIAVALGVDDMIIGLTIVAVGTSLPELASSIAAVRKGEDDIALGNIIGSNLFNTLAVVGLAGVISPMRVGAEVFARDLVVMFVFTVSLFLIGFGFGGPGRINRYEGAALCLGYLAYTANLLRGLF